MTLNEALSSMKAKLATVAGIKTVKIGIEANMSPADYPMIRVVPNRLLPGDPSHFRVCEVLVYFGLPILEAKDGLEAVLTQLMALEEQIVEVLLVGSGYKCQFLETQTSAGVVEHYELAVSRFKIIFPT